MEIQRESIFVSSLRAFFKSLFFVLGLITALFVASLLFSSIASPYRQESKTTMEILPDLNGKREVAPLSAPAILQINVHGVIGDCSNCGPNHITSEFVQNILVESREGFLQHDRVKGILLHFDTPGGSAIESDNIYRLLLKYKELFKVPVYGYVNGMCASGGMYIASAADRILCGPAGIVGSVGVRSGPFFNVYETITKWGIQSKTITEGLDKDMLNPVRPWKPNEDENLKEVMASLYRQFVNIVTAARPSLSKEKLVQEYGAKIFDGEVAKEYGYVDEANSSYEDAILSLMNAANINPEEPYQIIRLEQKRSLLEGLITSKSPLITGKMDHHAQLPSESELGRERIMFLL